MLNMLCALETKAILGIIAGVTIGIVAVVGAIAMALVIIKAVEGIARQPEADGKIRSTLILGLVFIETVIIYALIIAILIVINILG